MPADELWERLHQKELPKLWLPRRENCHQVDEIPLLGSGKRDLKKIKEMALQKLNDRRTT